MDSEMRRGAELDRAISTGALRAVVFDCDGVLFDSKQANIQFYNHILEKFGCPPVREEQHEYIHMYPAGESLRYLLGDGPKLEAALDYCRGMDFRQFNAYLRCEPGLVAFLESLKPAFKTALATNRTVSTQEVLSHFLLDKYFDLVLTASDVTFPKPHPEVMERILESFGVAPHETIYIGDSPVDEAVAAATSVFFVAYKNQRLKAHLHVNHFRELSRLFSPMGDGRTWNTL